MIGAATGDVANSFDAARHSAQSDLESFGINPGATRYAGLDVGIRTQEAAQQAAAGTEASNYVDETARQLRAQAIGEGQALPQQATQAQTLATQAGYGASYTGASALSAGAQATGSPIQYGALGEQGLQNVANITQMGFQDQMAKYQADQSSMGGFGQLLGLGAGLAGHAFGFAKGGIVPDSASPTAGKAIDDVPAKLTAGEFVMPEDAVRWMGEEKLHKMIAKAREARQAIPAQADTQIGAQGAQHLAKGGLVKKHPAHTNPGGFVRFVQQELAKQGYYNGKIDGVSGPKTQAALRQFQQDRGIEPTGQATPETLQYLQGNAPVQGSASAGGGDQGATASGAIPMGQPTGQPAPTPSPVVSANPQGANNPSFMQERDWDPGEGRRAAISRQYDSDVAKLPADTSFGVGLPRPPTPVPGKPHFSNADDNDPRGIPEGTLASDLIEALRAHQQRQAPSGAIPAQ